MKNHQGELTPQSKRLGRNAAEAAERRAPLPKLPLTSEQLKARKTLSAHYRSTPEYKAKKRLSAAKYAANPEFRAKRRAKRRADNATPEGKSKNRAYKARYRAANLAAYLAASASMLACHTT